MSKNAYAIFQVDEKMENEQGIWVEYPVPDEPKRGFKFRIVHAGDTNPHYRKLVKVLAKSLNFRIQQDLIEDDELEEKIYIPAFAEKIIKEAKAKDENGNWVDGIYGDDFAIIPANRENLTAMFSNAIRLFKDVKKQAESFALFKKEALEADEKK